MSVTARQAVPGIPSHYRITDGSVRRVFPQSGDANAHTASKMALALASGGDLQALADGVTAEEALAAQEAAAALVERREQATAARLTQTAARDAAQAAALDAARAAQRDARLAALPADDDEDDDDDDDDFEDDDDEVEDLEDLE